MHIITLGLAIGWDMILYNSIVLYMSARYGCKLQLQSGECVVVSRVVEEKTVTERNTR